MNKDELMEIMEQASSMRDQLEQKMNKVRKSSREANFKTYHQKKEEALNKAKQDKAFKLLQETKAKMEKEANKNRTEEIKKYEQQRGFRMW